MQPPGPSLFIFDMGGVVSRNTNVSIPVAGHLGLSLERFSELSRETLPRLVRGAIDSTEFWRLFAQRSGIEVREDLLARFFQPQQDPEVVALVRRLRRQTRVVVGTNTIDSHYRAHLERGDYAAFDAVYASHLMGLAKPDPAFYLRILEREGRSAGQAVFVDDLSDNVQAAAALGIRAFLFQEAAQLKRQLEKLLATPWSP